MANFKKKQFAPPKSLKKQSQKNSISYELLLPSSPGLKIAVAVIAILVGIVYVSIQPPPPKICGTPGGPAVTEPRIKLSDGRHLSYKEFGVPKHVAKYKVIIIHGWASGKTIALPISQELTEELKIYLLCYDRAGYGESDPNPKRSVKSEAYDIQQLADQMGIDKFYIMGYSIGGYPVWGCLHHIPHRLAGASLITPVVNYWWPSFPKDVVDEGFGLVPVEDRWMLRVAYYAPWLYYWWMTQKWFPASTMFQGDPIILSRTDVEIISKLPEHPIFYEERTRQQGDHYCLYRDVLASFGEWEFDPTNFTNPFPNNEATVHVWLGLEDRVIPYALYKYIVDKHPWLQAHVVPDGGHFFVYNTTICDDIVRSLVTGKAIVNLEY